MRLVDALRFSPGQVVAFTGAGGKTEAIRTLVSEWDIDSPLIVTTSTKFALDQSDLTDIHLVFSESEDSDTISESIASEKTLLVTGSQMEDEPKWLGLNEDELSLLNKFVKSLDGTLLIEADGARGRSLKAPAPYEPVVPSFCDLVVNIVALDVLNEKVDSVFVHRTRRVQSLLELGEGERLSWEHIVDLINSPDGGLKGVPDKADFRVLLNKVEGEERFKAGQHIGNALIKGPRVRSVILSSLIVDPPVLKVMDRVAGIILAAGTSSRLLESKQLIQWRGKPLVLHAVEAAMNGGLDPILVVVGEDEEALRVLFKDYPVRILCNPEPSRGQSSSVRVGIESLGEEIEAAIFLLADMPLITGDVVSALVHEHRSTLAPTIAPRADGQRGNPVLFDRSVFSLLKDVSGDRGGRAIFEQYPPHYVEWDSSVLFDVDSPEDLERLRSIE